MQQVILYAKAGCHLCDDAREILEDWAADHALEIQEIDIRRDPALFERYRYRIPVVVVDTVERLEGKIDVSELHALLASLGEEEL